MLKSILDTDLYKLTMQNAICKIYPEIKCKYKFTNRGRTYFPQGFKERLQSKIDLLSHFTLSNYQKDNLKKKCPFLDMAYLDFLAGYRFNPDEVKLVQEGSNLDITIEGYWYRTVLWEVPLMALISETYFEMMGFEKENTNILNRKDREKAKIFNENNISFVDYGTRRRESADNQERIIKNFKELCPQNFIGTSNPHFGIEYNTKIIGTYAHEWVSGISSIEGYMQSNKNAMERWVQIYQGRLGIALTDTFGSNAFFNDFNEKYAMLFDGVRHDSGDPFTFAENVIDHYKKLNINPHSKTIIFSDGLDAQKARDIKNYCNGRIKTSFGIGTNLTNDVGFKPLNIVIKLHEIKAGKTLPVIKLSDEEGKHTGNPSLIQNLKELLSYGK